MKTKRQKKTGGKMNNEDQFEKAKRLKPEFDKLSFADKIKFMDENFSQSYIGPTGEIESVMAPSGVGEISVYPDLKNPDEIRLWNEWFIRKIENHQNDLFIAYSFGRLKQRFESEIIKIRKSNPFPDDLCREYMDSQLKTYSERLKAPLIQREIEYYKGDWNLSKKIIGPSFLFARSYSNYVSFLKGQIEKGIPSDKLIKTFPDFLINIPDDKKEWFADQLSKEFKTEKGMGIRYMVEGLKKLNILVTGNRQNKKLFDAITNYFGRNIGTYNSVMIPKLTFEDEIQKAEKKIQFILNQINKK